MANDDDPEVERKARRARFILYVCMITLVGLPLVLWWCFGR